MIPKAVLDVLVLLQSVEPPWQATEMFEPAGMS
jgi:hypothetical protein